METTQEALSLMRSSMASEKHCIPSVHSSHGMWMSTFAITSSFTEKLIALPEILMSLPKNVSAEKKECAKELEEAVASDGHLEKHGP